jgi:hypothetical protein
VAPLSRLLNTRPSLRASALAALLSALVAVGLLAAAPAGAVVTEVVPGTSVGLQPRSTTLGTAGAKPKTFGNESGNVVLRGTSNYLIYWDPAKQFHHEWVTKIDTFFHQLGEVGNATPFADLSQYRDRSNSINPFHTVFKGAYSDTVKFPVEGCKDPQPLVEGAGPCLTDAQLREQIKSFVSSRGLPTGMNTVYFIVTPPGVAVCLDPAATHCSDFTLSAKEEAEGKLESTSYKNSFCSYHGGINPNSAPQGDGSTILYAAVPWTAGLLGLGGYEAKSLLYAQGLYCQDGGWNPEKGEEAAELAKKLTKPEEETIEKLPAKERKEAEARHRLEGPHQQEPNQEGKAESGDYSAGLADLIVNQVAVQEMNVVTDPLLTSWHDAPGNEVTDICRNVFASTGSEGVTGSVTADLFTESGFLSNTRVGETRYYINNIFNLSEESCDGSLGLVPRFTAPNTINAGEAISVDGMESTVTLIKGKAFGPSGPPTTTYATFSWNFGDGTEVTGFAPGAPTCEFPWLSPCAASALHSYQYGGTYNVTLTINDVGGYQAKVTHPVTVVGPAPPSPGKEAGGGSSGGSGGSASGGSSAPGGSAPVVKGSTPSPVAAAAVVSRSLRGVKHSGIVVRFSVNEQVAGHIEVLLDRALAHRLGISGAPAVGLPAGSAPAVVIGKALLITSKGGRSTTVVQLSKRTIARLQRMPKVTLMLRLSVRNADPHAPTTSTLLSVFTLSR